jgi:hypothetical protein
MLLSSPGITARISRPFKVTLQNRKLFLEKFSFFFGRIRQLRFLFLFIEKYHCKHYIYIYIYIYIVLA